MILGPVSLFDCIIFILFIIPQLLLTVGFSPTVRWVSRSLPQLIFLIPCQFIRDRFLPQLATQSAFIRKSSIFQDVVVRYVRFAFANLPPSLGRVFFSRNVSIPFIWWRMIRHGYLRPPIRWQDVTVCDDLKGVWIQRRATRPDIVIYYCHGGGFSMGSTYFYLEFLLAFVYLLEKTGFESPALFALEYALVPEAVYPTQIEQVLEGYNFVLKSCDYDQSRVCVAGDSAGATLILSMLLQLGEKDVVAPCLATLISPWCCIVSEKNRISNSDYLNPESLHLYGRQYINSSVPEDHSIASPGSCKDLQWWSRSSPTHGWFFYFGEDEVLAQETRELIAVLKACDNSHVSWVEEAGGIHAWPVARLYLGDSINERLEGLEAIVSHVKCCFKRKSV